MKLRVVPFLLAAVAAALAGGYLLSSGGGEPVEARAAAPVAIVDGQRVTLGALEHADAMIEERWLRGEAAERSLDVHGLAPARLRGAVGDAIGGGARDARALLAAFDAFHARWRARTTCDAAARAPYADRCSNHPPSQEGCRWLGEASVCAAGTAERRTWLTTQMQAGKILRRDKAPTRVAAADRALVLLRAARERRAAATAAQRRAEAARLQRERRALAHVSLPTFTRAQTACAKYRKDVDPYLFGAGMQDPRGQVEGLRAARRAAARELATAAYDDLDRRKLAPLLARLRSGDQLLAKADRVAAAGNFPAAQRVLARYMAGTKGDAALADRLGLTGCLTAKPRS